MTQLVVGDWATVTVMARIDPAGHWEVDVTMAEKYLGIKTTVPIASGSGPRWTHGQSPENLAREVGALVVTMVHRIIEPM
jgi:hypothetical protein